MVMSKPQYYTIGNTAQFAANAAETDGAVSANGTFGSCSWELDSFGNLTVSGSGSTGNFNSDPQPWAAYADSISSIEVQSGITSLGKSVFANLSNVTYVSLASSVTSIDQSAFYKCTSLTSVYLSESVASIGANAFLSTGLTGVVIPNSTCTVGACTFGYTAGKNMQMLKNNGFIIAGHSGSPAQTYADTNSFGFVDLDSDTYPVSVSMGSAINVLTGRRVTEAHAGERIMAVADRQEGFFIFNGFVSYDDNVVLGENDTFTMPAESVHISMDTTPAFPLNIDLSGGSACISSQQYDYLVGLIGDGVLNGTARSGAEGCYDITLPDNASVFLTPTEINLFDDDYAPSYSLSLPNRYMYNPVNFIFANEQIYQADVDVTLPAAGSPWNYETMSADVAPRIDGYNYGNFTVENAVWYDSHGLSAFDTFEGGETYFVGFDIIPNNGYCLTLTTDVDIYVPGKDEPIRVKPQYMDLDGSIHCSNGSTYDQIRLVGGDPNDITVNNGFATLSDTDIYGEDAVTEAVPGQEVFLRPALPNPDAYEYIVMMSDNAASDDVQVYSSERIGWYYFYMPNHDVEVTVSYETDTQTDVALDFYNGPVTVSSDGNLRSQAYGVSNVLSRKAAIVDYIENGKKFDIDGDGSWDIQAQNSVYSLLPTSSLSQNTTLTLDNREYPYSPVKRVLIQLTQPVAYNITVNNGVASSQNDDYYNNHVITAAYPGDTVYVVPKYSDIGDDFYIVQSSMTATGNAQLYDEAGVSFVMPDHDVTVTLDYDYALQDISILDFRYYDTVTLPASTGPASETYGVFAAIWQASANSENVSDDVTRYDVDGDGSWDIERDSSDETYTLLSTHSLITPSGSYNIALTREQSWTLPIRTVYVFTGAITSSTVGDVDYDGEVTIQDVTLLLRHLAEFLTPNNGPLIDENNPDHFYRADANHDGKINVNDITAMQRHLAGIEELTP